MIDDILEAGIILAAFFLIATGALSLVYLPLVLGVASLQFIRTALARENSPQRESGLLVHHHPRPDVSEVPEEQRIAVTHTDTAVA